MSFFLKKLNSFSNLLREINDLGLKGALFRINYELLNRSGFRKIIQPIKKCTNISKDYYLGEQLVNLEWFKKNRKDFFVNNNSKLSSGFKNISSIDLESVIKESQLAAGGQIKCFSCWYGDYGNPIDWHLNPKRNISWPKDVHWSQILQLEPKYGDCKLTWEVNRFTHIYNWIRVYIITKDSRWVQDFNEQIESWEENNFYRAGVNWNSGQELAIRALTWIFALHVFIDDSAFQEEDFQRLMRLLYLHAEHIYANINFARIAVHNNHLIGEALALYTIGAYFPWMKGASKWKKKGRGLLENDCLKQFYEDSGYCQCSHNYHRLALHYYLWAYRIAECLSEPFPKKIYDILEKSGEYLNSFVNEKDGRLPNWGANDGALFCPWTSCDYSDFRPVLNSLRYLTKKKRAFPDGSWDEELLWLWGPEALKAPVKKYKSKKINIIPISGIHCIRQGDSDFATLRCGSMRDRFGQADQLHIDIWWKGYNVAQDGGSYLYNDEMQYHRYFVGTCSHNTINIDNLDQTILLRRFKWMERVKAKLIYTEEDENNLDGIVGEQYGYCRLPGKLTHRRGLWSLSNGIYIVVDKIIQKQNIPHKIVLQWLLGPWEINLKTKNNWQEIVQNISCGKYSIYLNIFNEQIDIVKEKDLSVVKGREGQNPRGWVSRYYGEREAVNSIELAVNTEKPVFFISIFTPSELDLSFSLENSELIINFEQKLQKINLDKYFS